MTIPSNSMFRAVWDVFNGQRPMFLERGKLGGDQLVIEQILGAASIRPQILQHTVPPGFFLHYRDVMDHRHPEARVVVFGGRSRPDNCTTPWVRELWS